jgi:photosystem II stability/assembly factor-like uncharacterized protein
MLLNNSRGHVLAITPILAAICLLSPSGMPAAVTAGTSSWAWQNPLPQGDNLNAVSCPSATVCYAVGEPGTILATTNAGVTWNGQSSNTNVALRGISCPSTTTCVAVGDAGTILYTITGGNTWITQSIGTAQLTGVSCPSTSSCFAVGPTSGVWFTGGLGSSAFEEIKSASGLTSISCPNPANSTAICYVAGNPTGFPTVARLSELVSVFGRIWGLADLSIPKISGSLTAISCPNASTCVAVSNGSTLESGSDMIGTTNSGQSWNGAAIPQSLQSVSCVNSISGSSNTAPICYAVGNGKGPDNTVYIANPGEVQFFSSVSAGELFFTSEGHQYLYRVSCQPEQFTNGVGLKVTNGICFAVGEGGAIVTNSPSSGNAWTQQETTVGQAQGLLQNENDGELDAVSCPQPGTCYAIGNGTGFLASINGGPWTVKNSTINGSAISCPTTSVCYVGGSNSLLVTTNGGTTWAQEYPSGQNPNEIFSLSCPSIAVCVAVGDEYTLFTTNGTTWSDTFVPIGPTAVSCPTTTMCMAVGYGGSFSFTTNLGPTGTKWSSGANTGAPGDLYAVSCPSAAFCIAVGESGGFLVGRFATSLNTWDWDVFAAPIQSGDSFAGVSCLPTTLIPQGLCYAVTDDEEIVSATTAFSVQPVFNLETALNTDATIPLSGVSCAGATVSSALSYECVAVGELMIILSKTVGPVGTGTLTPSTGSSLAGEPTTFQLTWTVPSGQVWRDLEYVELKLSGQQGTGLWARFIPGEPVSDFALLNDDGIVVAEGASGSSGVLDSPTATLDLTKSGFAAAGPTSPTVTVNFVVTFKPGAAVSESPGAARLYDTEISAANLTGTVQEPQQVGHWAVLF